MLAISFNALKYVTSREIKEQHKWGLTQLPENSSCIYSAPLESTFDGGERINFIVSGMGQTFAQVVGDKYDLKLCEQ